MVQLVGEGSDFGRDIFAQLIFEDRTAEVSVIVDVPLELYVIVGLFQQSKEDAIIPATQLIQKNCLFGPNRDQG